MRGWVGAGLLGLAACAPGTAPVGVATVRAEPVAGAEAPLARGESQLVVRTAVSGRPGEEVPASCVAESPYFRSSFQSPARLLLPDYGAASPNITVTCRAGSASGSGTALPEAVWQGGVGGGWPAVGISVGTGDLSGVGVGLGWYGGGVGAGSGVPVTRYRDLRIELG